MLTQDDMTYFFRTYFNNFISSIAWEDRLLEPCPKEEWIAKLRQCAREQKQLSLENNQLISVYLDPLKDYPELLSDEGYDQMLSFCRKLYYSNYFEPTLLLRVTEQLLPHYQDSQDTESLLFLYICSGYACFELSRTGDSHAKEYAAHFYEKAISLRDKIESFELEQSREYIFIAYYNLTCVAPQLGILTKQCAYDYWKEFCLLRTQDKFCRFDAANPQIPVLCDLIMDHFLSLNNSTLPSPSELSSDIEDELNTICNERFEQLLAETGSIYKCTPYIVFSHYRHLAETNRISWEEAWSTLHDIYIHHCKNAEKESISTPILFYCNLPINLIDFLQRTSFSDTFKQEYYHIYHDIFYRFLTMQPVSYDSYSIDNGLQIVCFHPCILSTFDNKVDKINFIFDFIVAKHLSTFTHSVMVSYLAERVARAMLDDGAELLVGTHPKTSLSSVLRHKEDVIDYIVRAALLHDLGKNGLIPIINTQHRRLSRYEFNIIKMHPQKGATHLAVDSDFEIYQDIALGHHKSYDGTQGYPNDFDNTKSLYKPAIDLIHICDCLDAATDYLSRNYHTAKSFDCIMEELNEKKGTDYHPGMIDYIQTHPKLYDSLKDLTEKKREDIYYDIFQTYRAKRSPEQ